jgi:hypothetical protein
LNGIRSYVGAPVMYRVRPARYPGRRNPQYHRHIMFRHPIPLDAGISSAFHRTERSCWSSITSTPQFSTAYALAHLVPRWTALPLGFLRRLQAHVSQGLPRADRAVRPIPESGRVPGCALDQFRIGRALSRPLHKPASTPELPNGDATHAAGRCRIVVDRA